MKNIILLILILIGISCTKSPSEFLIGKWQILNVVENDQSIELNDNWMHLKSDGTFNSHDGDSDKNENGKWTYIENEKVLYIDDGSGNSDGSEWILSFKSDTLIFSAKKDSLYLIAKKLK